MITQIKLHDCKSELREADLRATPTRLGVLQILETATTPLDVTTILSELRKKGIDPDKATIFRMMHSFLQKGLVREINLSESKNRYEYRGKGFHHHLICQVCGVIEDMDDCNIDIWEKELRKKKGFIVKRHSLEFFGLCKNCQN